MEAEVVEQVPLQLPCRLVGDPAAAEIRVRREAPEIRDLAPLVCDVESHRTGALPVVSVRRLDHEPAALKRLPLGALDLREQGLAVARAPDRHERLDVLVIRELEQEADVFLGRAADANVHSATGAGRRAHATRPEPRATPARMRTSPISFCGLSDSSRRVDPYRSANGGSR